MKKNLLLVAAGLALAFVLYEGYYWHNVLVWVDNIRISEMIKEAAKQQKPQPPQAP